MQGRVIFGVRHGVGQGAVAGCDATLCSFFCRVSCEIVDLKNPVIPLNAALSLLLHIFSEILLIPVKDRANAFGH